MNEPSNKIIDKKTVFSGVRFDVETLHFQGKEGKKIQRDVVRHSGAVVILPILNENEIVLIQNERFGVGKILWELPAGMLEPDEKPHDTAKRELLEETGYEARQVELLTTFYSSPGICDELMYAYSATDLTYKGQSLDDTEEISVEVISWKKALEMVKDGTIEDAKTIATLLYFTTFNRNKSQK